MSDSASPATGTAQIGVTGLAVMGSNIARNFARHGYTVALHNRSVAKTDALLAEHGSGSVGAAAAGSVGGRLRGAARGEGGQAGEGQDGGGAGAEAAQAGRTGGHGWTPECGLSPPGTTLRLPRRSARCAGH